MTDVIHATHCAFCDARFRSDQMLAFDVERARLWAVCKRCGQWNLAPLELEERRRAVERLELEFRSTSEKGGRGPIAVARVGKLTLIRIGRASWSEFAAWRYGRRLRSRHLAGRVTLLLGLAATFFLFFTKPGAYLTALPFASLALSAWSLWGSWGMNRRVVWRTRTPSGKVGTLRFDGACEAELLRDGADGDGWKLALEHSRGIAVLRGDEAVRALSVIMPAINFYGAGDARIDAAIQLIERVGGPERVFAGLAGGRLKERRPEELVALEMAAHERDESRALAGDLGAIRLELAEADERARIVDQLT